MQMKKAEYFLERDDFKSAYILLKSMEIEKQDSYTKDILEKKLDQLDQETKRRFTNYEEALKLSQQKEVLRRTHCFTAGLQALLFTTPLYDVNLFYLTDSYSGVTSQYNIAQMITRIGIGFTFNMNYYISNRYRAGWGIEYGRNYQKYKRSKSSFGTDFNIKYIALNVSATYLFRHGVGYRHVFLENEINSLFSSGYYSYRSRIVIQGYNTQVTQICLNFGFEFISDPKSHFVAEFQVQTFYNLVKSEIIGNFGINLGIKAGGIF